MLTFYTYDGVIAEYGPIEISEVMSRGTWYVTIEDVGRNINRREYESSERIDDPNTIEYQTSSIIMKDAFINQYLANLRRNATAR